MPTQHPRFKTAIYEQIARIGKATASPARLELLDLLAQGPRTVEALASQIGQSVANTSHHLQVLRGARLVEAEKAGTYVTYRLADPQVARFRPAAQDAGPRATRRDSSASARTSSSARGALEPVSDDELLRRVRGGEVTVIDVRPTRGIRSRPHPQRDLRAAGRSQEASARVCRRAARSSPTAAARTA